MALRILMVGGGSGGHFYPLMSIAESLRTTNENVSLYYAGPNPYNKAALDALNIRYVWCPAGKRRKYTSFLNVLDIFKTLFGILVALIKLFILYPDVVVSKGGYTSIPIILAGWFYRIPILVHESDAVVGTANKLGMRFARAIAVSYPKTLETISRSNVHFTGIPIRQELLESARPQDARELGIDNDLPIILVLGGSQGAERVNELILESLDELLPAYNIIHQTGEQSFSVTVLSARELIRDNTLIARYHPIAFLEASVLNQALHAATLVISRAGSGSIHEIAVHGKPSVLIPIPEEISHDQRTNAYTYAATGAAIVIEEHNLKGGLLRAEIDRIMQNSELYTSMTESARTFAPRSAGSVLANTIIELAKSH